VGADVLRAAIVAVLFAVLSSYARAETREGRSLTIQWNDHADPRRPFSGRQANIRSRCAALLHDPRL